MTTTDGCGPRVKFRILNGTFSRLPLRHAHRSKTSSSAYATRIEYDTRRTSLPDRNNNVIEHLADSGNHNPIEIAHAYHCYIITTIMCMSVPTTSCTGILYVYGSWMESPILGIYTDCASYKLLRRPRSGTTSVAA